ncbi:two component response regulator protein [Herbaspirillum frisingense GSF30]|uniref:Two component response regulator protein n=1 Tax=Herbaspirillum frisingense GSF30 TaxID=864073 RepID=A0AAI9N4Z8_9BURK|nr:response regulator [Herbaspirillum frisingense]EOA06083.1 two component response regulator protein [Herbaspirillum frisingense GSF30]
MHKTALIATSRPEVSRALTEWLAINDIDIQIAGSGNDAIEHIALDRPDLVLAQLAMEGMSGLRLAHYLKAQDTLADVPVILLCRDEREMDLVKGQWPAFLCAGPLNPALISELKRELVN